jgi:hypothetical protein
MPFRKDGKNYDGGCIVLGNLRIFNPTPEQLRQAGFEEYIPEPPPALPPEPPVLRYSKRKIIHEFKSKWPAIKGELERLDLYDEFVNSAYIESTDELYVAVIDQLDDEDRIRLDGCCLYDE